jgi:hypothetical protein
MTQISKYSDEFMLEFTSIDRFIFRASDVFRLDDHSNKESLSRLDNCHVYFLAKRPRVSLVPESVRVSSDAVCFDAEWRIEGIRQQDTLRLPRDAFGGAELSFAVSPYPHRILVSYGADGEVIAETLFATSVHLFKNLPDEVRDLEVVYIGKGLRNSARDRLAHHETLQRILGDINSDDPNAEAFAVVHGFKYRKPVAVIAGVPAEITGDQAAVRRNKAAKYRPSLEEQVSLIEATCISYFQTSKYNTHYLDFPKRHHRMLRPVYDADFALLSVQLDHSMIGGQRLYSQKVAPASEHLAQIDFRSLEGRSSWLGLPSR